MTPGVPESPMGRLLIACKARGGGCDLTHYRSRPPYQSAQKKSPAASWCGRAGKAVTLTPEERKAIAKKAAKKRRGKGDLDQP